MKKALVILGILLSISAFAQNRAKEYVAKTNPEYLQLLETVNGRHYFENIDIALSKLERYKTHTPTKKSVDDARKQKSILKASMACLKTEYKKWNKEHSPSYQNKLRKEMDNILDDLE